MNNQVHFLEFCSLLRDISLPTVLQGCPRVRLLCCNGPLSGGACALCRTIYKSGLSLLFLCQLIIKNSYEAIGAGWEREGHVTGVGTTGTWATSSCNLCMSSGPAQTHSLIYHFHWWRSVVVHAQLCDVVGQITPSSWWAAQIAWLLCGPWSGLHYLLRPTSRPRLFPKRRLSYLQRMAGPCPQILRVSIVFHLEGSKQHPFPSLIIQAPLDLLGHRDQVAKWFAQEPGFIAECSLLLGPIQNQQLSRLLGKMDQRTTAKWGISTFSLKSKEFTPRIHSRTGEITTGEV